jgi:outer membrane protein assembly factor BamD
MEATVVTKPVIFGGKWLITLLIMSFGLSGCALFDGDDELEVDLNSGEQQMYRRAQRFLDTSNFDLAISALQQLESRYPFGKYAEQAQLELIYAHYGAYQSEAAIEAADRFIRLHPQHPSVDYAYYMKGVSAYDMNKNFFSSLVPSDDSKRDVSGVREAFDEFTQLLTRYPNSRYAQDARARMVYIRNMLARHEIHVANYYFKRGAYMAALKRGQNVVENMQETTAVADGLAVMAQAYILLEMSDLAMDSVRVLCANYPEHPNVDADCNFKGGYDRDGFERSWLNDVTFGLLDPPTAPQFDYRPGFES